MAQTPSNLTEATQWLTAQAMAYGADAQFIYDWTDHEDLFYEAAFTQDLVISGTDEYDAQVAFIEENIDVQRLINKYCADNVIYFFYFNTDYDNDVRPWSLGYTSGESFMTEIVNLYVKFEGEFDSPPATYAHEILHTFGAHDLYYSSAAISQNYVNYCEESGSNDIMFTVNSESYITVELTPLDAAPAPVQRALTVKNGGTVYFTGFAFDEPGDYRYLVAERSGGAARTTYDTHSYTVTVRVTGRPDGGLAAGLWAVRSGETTKADGVLFVNWYDPPETAAAAVTASAARAGTRTVKAAAPAALPQTGDGFPIEALAAAFCASVIGFGTAWKRR